MTDAVLRVVSAGPLVTVQDAGRPGHLRFGVPASGPMDRLAHAAANVSVGARSGATAIEVSIAGLALDCEAGPVTLAVTGGGFRVARNDTALASWSVVTLRRGDRLRVEMSERGRWAYVAVAGSIDASPWLGATATHSMSGFGGGALATGDVIEISDARSLTDRDGPIEGPSSRRREGVRVVMGPQDQHFTAASLEAFRTRAFAITPAGDRMGTRLDGPALELTTSLSLPSEPVVRGSVQVAGDGVATVLLADHQTTGGYPKIATVVSADLDDFTQLRPPDTIRFEPVTPAEAVQLTREHTARTTAYLDHLRRPSLAVRLATENLIGESPASD